MEYNIGEENPNYIVVSNLSGKHCVSLMVWNKREQEYRPQESRPAPDRLSALLEAQIWAMETGLGVKL